MSSTQQFQSDLTQVPCFIREGGREGEKRGGGREDGREGEMLVGLYIIPVQLEV